MKLKKKKILLYSQRSEEQKNSKEEQCIKDGYLIHAVPQVITLGSSVAVIMQVYLNASLESILTEIMLQHQKK